MAGPSRQWRQRGWRRRVEETAAAAHGSLDVRRAEGAAAATRGGSGGGGGGCARRKQRASAPRELRRHAGTSRCGARWWRRTDEAVATAREESCGANPVLRPRRFSFLVLSRAAQLVSAYSVPSSSSRCQQ
uniref:Uncharacterized protein n=1 Tax=Oryza glumipatula TaxID=40148 RepID=A0A0D9ZGY1_9ORYZ